MTCKRPGHILRVMCLELVRIEMYLKALLQILQVCPQHVAQHVLVHVPKILKNENSLQHDAAQARGKNVLND